MSSMTIAKLASAGGVGVETVRYYQRRGLMAEPVRSGSGIRRYGEEDVRHLRFIRAAQAAGFTLEDIAELLALDARDDRVRAREMARDRLDALDAKIVELQHAREALSRLRDICEGGSDGPCPILSAFELGHC